MQTHQGGENKGFARRAAVAGVAEELGSGDAGAAVAVVSVTIPLQRGCLRQRATDHAGGGHIAMGVVVACGICNPIHIVHTSGNSSVSGCVSSYIWPVPRQEDPLLQAHWEHLGECQRPLAMIPIF